MAYTRSVIKIAGTGCLAPLLAGLLLGGCVNSDPVKPEATNLLWNEVDYPPMLAITCIATDPDGRIFLGGYDYGRDYSYGGSALYVSSDNGETWARKLFGPSEIRDIAIDSEGRVFATGCSRSILRSMNHGESWETLSDTLRTSCPRKLVIDSSDNIYLPTSTNGIYFSSDHGETWTQIGEGIIAAGKLSSLDVNSKGCLFAIASGTLYRSCDRGGSWTEPGDVPQKALFGAVVIDSKDQVFVRDTRTLYRSADDGETWTARELPFWFFEAILTDGRDRLYATGHRTLYRSEDGGDSWALVLNLSSNSPGCITSNPAGDIFVAGTWGVSRSIDGGANWEMLGFTVLGPAAIAIDRHGFFYIGMACGGVYRSSNDIERWEWERFNRGLPDVRLNCLVSTDDSTLMAGTSHGIYTSPEDRPAWSLAGLAEFSVTRLFLFPGDSIAAVAAGTGLFMSDRRWKRSGAISGSPATTFGLWFEPVTGASSREQTSAASSDTRAKESCGIR